MEEKKKKTLRRVLIGAGIVGLCVEAARDFKEMKSVGNFVVNAGEKVVSGVKSIFGGEKSEAEEGTKNNQSNDWKRNQQH